MTQAVTVTEPPPQEQLELKATATNGIPKKAEPTQAWKTLSQLLPPRDPNSNFWWAVTGKQLSFMLDAAGYPIERQYEALLFHYHWATPNMGTAPTPSGSLKWRSLITVEGGPVEYSWKWPTTTSEPDIRYSLEPINAFSGTPEDPLNQAPATQLLNRLAAVVPGVDLTMTNHFLATLFDHDKSAYLGALAAAGVSPSSTFGIAAEFVPKGLGFKAYFVPRKLAPPPADDPLAHWTASLRQLSPQNPSRDALLGFLEGNAVGQKMNPLLLAVDCVKPESSRLKWYFQSPAASFESVREIMTLGGVRDGLDAELEELRELMLGVLGLPDDFPEGEDVPLAARYDPANKENENFVALPGLLTGFVYYFDIQPRGRVPEVKLYIPVWRYGRDDLSVARGTAAWMEKRGRGRYSERFLGMLRAVAEHRDLGDGLGLQTYVTCVLKKGGEADVTTYMSAELLHPERLKQMVG